MRRDDILMNKVIEEAGLLSRASARLKALGGAAKQAASDVGTAVSGKKPSPDAGWRGKYTKGKQEQILKTLSNDIIKDLTKLKLVPTGSPLNPVDLQNTLTQYISKYTGVGGQQDKQPEQQTTQPSPESSFAPTNTTDTTTSTNIPTTPAPQSTSTPTTPAPQSTSTPTTPAPQSTSTSATQVNTPTPTSETSAQETPQEAVPLGTTITDSKGNVYRYTSPDEIGQTTSKGNLTNPMDGQTVENGKWYELSKSGKSAMDTVNDKAQSAISTAWQKQNAKQKQEQENAEIPTFESFKKYFWK